MRFALFYEIPVARPWDARQRAPRVQEHARAGGRRRAGRLRRVLDRRAPLPRGVLALLEPRGALRRDRGADRAHAPRLRRAADAEAVQPPGAHRRVGRRARPASPTAASTSAPAARRRASSSRGSASTRTRRARCGRRRSSTSSAAGRTTSTSSRASTGRCRSGACSRSRCSSRTRRSGARPTSDDGHRQVGELGLGLCSFAVGVPPEEVKAKIDIYREARRQVHRARSASSSTTRPRRSRWRCARRHARRRGRRARESFEWYPKVGRPPDRAGRGVDGGAQAGRSATTTTRPTCKRIDDDGSLDLLQPRVPRRRRARACSARPTTCVEACRRYEAAGVDLLLCLVNPYKIPHEQVMQTIDLMGKHVIPEFK